MGKQIGVELNPKLRFPEFQNDPEWNREPLNQIADPVTDKATVQDSDAILTLSAEHGLVMQGDYFGKKIAGDDASRYTKIIHDDFVYNDRTTKLSVYGTIKRLSKHQSGMVSPIYKCFRFRNGENPAFWEGYFDAGTHDSQLGELVNEGARAGRFNISIQNFLSTYAVHPKNDEQQKLADCLSSIDEVIAMESQKLEALKKHKNGLLEGLFPKEGEAFPAFRFPEFRNEPGWRAKTFGELCKFVRGPFGGALKKEIFVQDGYAIYEQFHAIYQNFDFFRYYITEEKYNEMKRFSVLPNDIIMSCSGTMGKFAIIPENSKKGIINQALLKLTVKKDQDIRFIKFTLEHQKNQKTLLAQSAGGAIKNVVSVDQMKEITLHIPDFLEQQKIANCLSSVDDLIIARSHKIDKAMAHKKGLMQQLFPSFEETR